MDIENIKENKELFEKVLLAYWYSIPYDNDTTPEKVELIRDNGSFYNVNFIRKGQMYGTASIQKKEVDRYLVKLKDLKAHEKDIINRLDNEVTKTNTV